MAWRWRSATAHLPKYVVGTARAAPRYNAVVLLLALAIACGGPDPVLQAVPSKSAEQIADKREAAERRVSPQNIDARYQKPDGVYVDARYLGGRDYRVVRAEVEQQLGAVVEEREVPDGAKEVVFERGTLRLRGDKIQVVDVPLPEPMRRGDAMAALGFPPATGEYQALTLEFRLLNTWGFRRIRFFRKERGSEDVVRVQAVRFSDGDG